MKRFTVTFLIAFIAGSLFLFSWQDVVAQRGYPLGFDIYIRWEAARAMWQGGSPYSDEVTARSDLDIYGRGRGEDEIAYGFYDPAYTAVVLSPLAVLPLDWVGVVWSAMGLAALIALLVEWSWQLEPRPSPLVWGLILISGILYRPAIMTILNGQFSLFLAGFAALSWWLIVRDRDIPAGILLAVSTIKPSIFLFVPLVLMLWALRWKRWRLIFGFIGTLAALGIITLIQIGWWIPDFLHRLNEYNQTLGSQIVFSWSPKDINSLPGILWLVQSMALGIIGFWKLYQTDEFPWLASLAALNLNLLATPHIVEYDLGILLLSLFWLGAGWAKHRWGISALVLLLWIPWVSWILVIAFGGSTLQWQNLIWQMYPNLLLVCAGFGFG